MADDNISVTVTTAGRTPRSVITAILMMIITVLSHDDLISATSSSRPLISAGALMMERIAALVGARLARTWCVVKMVLPIWEAALPSAQERKSSTGRFVQGLPQ